MATHWGARLFQWPHDERINDHLFRHWSGESISLLEIGKQDDAAFLDQVASSHGPFDLGIDDGPHAHSDQMTTVVTTIPHLEEGDVYGVDDLFSSDSKDAFHGATGLVSHFADHLKSLVDGLKGWFWRQDFSRYSAGIGRIISSLNIHPTLAILIEHHLSAPVGAAG